MFVDDTGRRRILTRRAGRIVVLGFTGYLGLVALGFARDPRVGPVHLPTFGLPSLGLVVPPAPAVLDEQATGTAASSAPPAAAPVTSTGRETATPRPTTPPRALAPAGSQDASGKAKTTTTTTTTTTGVPALSVPTTASSSSSTTTSTTSTSTMSPAPGQDQGQGQGQGFGTAATKGPDGSGPPGQLRKTTATPGG